MEEKKNADDRIINDNTASLLPPALPPVLGLGRGAPLLKPTPPRRRVNGSVSQQAEDPTTTTDETSEKLQLIRVKFLRLSHRLGQTPSRNVVVAQFLHRLGLAELSRGSSSIRVGSTTNRAISMAEQLEAAGGEDPLGFSCTIMLLGKSGVGKSATINSIFDDDHQVKTDAFEMGTKRVQLVEGFVQGIKVRVIDTPGLSPSCFDNYKNVKTLKSIRAFIKKSPPDVVLYLDRLDTIDDDDMFLLRTITRVLGPSIWSNAIVGLTHASSAPPDGAASSYDMFVTRRCHAIQLDIGLAAGDARLVNPHVSLVENHPACRTNRAGQKVLPNGQAWKPHLLLLSFASKILAQEYALLKLLDNNNNNNYSLAGRPLSVAARSKAPLLPVFLSYLLESDQRPPRLLTKAEISRLIVGPVLVPPGWDHDINIGYDGLHAAGTLVDKEKIHMSYSGLVAETKRRRKLTTVQLEMASLVVHGEEDNKSTSLDFQMQKSTWRELFCTLQSDTNFWKQKAAAGLDVTLLGDSVSAGVKSERKLIDNKRFGMNVYGGGAMTSRGDAAYWGSLEAQLLGSFLSTLGLSVVDGHGGLAIGGNIQTQVPIGRSSHLTARANMNSRGAVQVSIRANIFEQLQHAMAALVPLFKKLLRYYSP